MNYETICTIIEGLFRYGKVTEETKGYNKALMDVIEKVRETHNEEIRSR